MKVLEVLLLGLVGIIALLLQITLFLKKEHYVKREIGINTLIQKVFDF